MARRVATLDGNEAAALVAHRLSEIIALYPITPSTSMGELADAWSSEGRTNLWGAVPEVVQMQSEAGVAGALHGALQAGALATTFTSSQGLLLMIPNLYKIAGELTAAVVHVAARSLAAQALSIFGDQSDVMAARQTGFALLASSSVQEAMDMAAVAHGATLRARVPFLHFFDGFRTSHEIQKIELLEDDDLRALIDVDGLRAHRERALNPNRPMVRGTAQNPDVYFQARERANPYYLTCPTVVQETMDRLAARTGRAYHLFDYVGAPEAERVIVLMGSGVGAAEEVVEYLNGRGEAVGLVKVRLYRPFDAEAFAASLPASARALAVLDRTKEPGSVGEPLYLDVVAALEEAGLAPAVIGGRYGLSSKEFTPAMVRAVFDELDASAPRRHFTVGVRDDVTATSLEVDPDFHLERDDTVRAMFFGLGSDGTVSANKNSIKIIGESTEQHVQGYFVYDSKKSGQVTISHLRFGPSPIRSTYQIQSAGFVAVHQFEFLEKVDVLRFAAAGATFLLNSPYGPDEVWDHLPRSVQQTILEKGLRLYVIDADQVARQTGMGGRINTIMQTAFFALSGVLPRDEAIAAIKSAIERTYGRRGREAIEQNFAAVDAALAHLERARIGAEVSSAFERRPAVPPEAPEFVRRVTAAMLEGRGDELPVSALPDDGTYPPGTTRWEKRNLAAEIPVWEPDLCIQCGKCTVVCPHSALRMTVFEPALLEDAPDGFRSMPARFFREFRSKTFSLQVAPEDCTGCGLCVEACPVHDKNGGGRKALNLEPQAPRREEGRRHWEFFLTLPEPERAGLPVQQVKYSQLLTPLFEFPGACAGCGETPYLKLVSQLFGDRAVIANATGCSSIYGANLPTTPWTTNAAGRGPAWSNSLFEDNAEFGFGIRVALDQRVQEARRLLQALAGKVGEALAQAILDSKQESEAEIRAQRERVAELGERLREVGGPEAERMRQRAEDLVKKSVWIVGGDGWAYDIGYGGLDHVLASGRDVNILVLDTEVYSNTGGQRSKATPRGAVAKFAAGGKDRPKKDLGLLAMTYGDVYVARIALGADDAQAVRSIVEAERHSGPSLILAYSPCIAHGYDLVRSLDQQKAAVASAYWPLYRYQPDRRAQNLPALVLDSKPPSLPLEEYLYREGRYQELRDKDPEAAERLLTLARADVMRGWETLARMADGAGAREAVVAG